MPVVVVVGGGGGGVLTEFAGDITGVNRSMVT